MSGRFLCLMAVGATLFASPLLADRPVYVVGGYDTTVITTTTPSPRVVYVQPRHYTKHTQQRIIVEQPAMESPRAAERREALEVEEVEREALNARLEGRAMYRPQPTVIIHQPQPVTIIQYDNRRRAISYSTPCAPVYRPVEPCYVPVRQRYSYGAGYGYGSGYGHSYHRRSGGSFSYRYSSDCGSSVRVGWHW